MPIKLKIAALTVMLLITSVTVAFEGELNKMTLDLHGVRLTDAVSVLGKFMQRNVVMSPNITGSVTVHWHDVNATQALDSLLVSQGLSQWHEGDVWFVAPHYELAKRKQEELKLAEALSATAPMQTRTWQLRYAKAEDIAQLIQDVHYSLLSARGGMRLDARTNSIYIKDTAAQIKAVAELVQHFDVPVQQVLIEARLASVDSDYERELGVSFAVHSPLAGRFGGGSFAEAGGSFAPHYSLAVATLANGAQLDMALSALEDAGKGELISSPSLFTANRETATIESGEDIPYQETSANGATSVTFKKAVLSLRVTPQIMPGKRVLLQLKVNQDRPSNRIVLGVPAISTRQIVTNVMVGDGATLVLGGIYELNKEDGEQRLPFLSQIPVVGWLFTLHNKKESKRELLIFVTPKIVS